MVVSFCNGLRRAGCRRAGGRQRRTTAKPPGTTVTRTLRAEAVLWRCRTARPSYDHTWAVPTPGTRTCTRCLVVAAERTRAVPCWPPPSTRRVTRGCTISASSRVSLPAVVAVTVAAREPTGFGSVTGSSAPGPPESPEGATAPARTVPRTVRPARNVVTPVLPCRRSTTGITSARRCRPRAYVALLPSRRETYLSPLYCDSPVHADAGCTIVASPESAPLSASTRSVPTYRWTDAVSAIRRATGWASRASIVSSPWMVDSAPEFWLTVPSRATPSKVTPVAGS